MNLEMHETEVQGVMSPRRARETLIFYNTTTQAPEKLAVPSISDDISADKGSPKPGGKPIHHIQFGQDTQNI